MERTILRAPLGCPLLGLLLATCYLLQHANLQPALGLSSIPHDKTLRAHGAPHDAETTETRSHQQPPDELIQSIHTIEHSSARLLSDESNDTSTSSSAATSSMIEAHAEPAANQTTNSSSAASGADNQSAPGNMAELSALEAAHLGYFRHSPLTSVILTIAYTIVFVIGIVGNSFVVAIVCKSPRMRTVTNYFIVNLAFADILVLLFCLPATLIGNLFIPYVLGLFMCKTVSYLQGVAVGASINTMVTVTLDRFLAICFPMDWHMSRRTARRVIACIWLFSASISAPWAVYFTLVPYPLDNITIQVCAEDWPSERLGTLYFVCANLILLYLFPATVIILCYLGIWYKIERRNIPGDRPQGLKIELIMQKSKIKVIKMMMFVVVIFLLSWAPLYLIFTRIKLAAERSPWEDWLITKMMPLAQWLGASNSCINPILYTFFNRKYKRGFFDLFRFAFCCDRSMKYEKRAESKRMITNGTEFVRLDLANSQLSAGWNPRGAQNNGGTGAGGSGGGNSPGQQQRAVNLSSENSNSTRVTGYSTAEGEFTSLSNQSKNGGSRRQIGFTGGAEQAGPRAVNVATLSPTTSLPAKRRPHIRRGDALSSSMTNTNCRLASRRLSAGQPSLGNNSSLTTTTTTIEEEDYQRGRSSRAGRGSLCQSSSNAATTSIDCDDLHDDDEDEEALATASGQSANDDHCDNEDQVAAQCVGGGQPAKRKRQEARARRSSDIDEHQEEHSDQSDCNHQVGASTGAKLDSCEHSNNNDRGLAHLESSPGCKHLGLGDIHNDNNNGAANKQEGRVLDRKQQQQQQQISGRQKQTNRQSECGPEAHSGSGGTNYFPRAHAAGDQTSPAGVEPRDGARDKPNKAWWRSHARASQSIVNSEQSGEQPEQQDDDYDDDERDLELADRLTNHSESKQRKRRRRRRRRRHETGQQQTPSIAVRSFDIAVDIPEKCGADKNRNVTFGEQLRHAARKSNGDVHNGTTLGLFALAGDRRSTETGRSPDDDSVFGSAGDEDESLSRSSSPVKFDLESGLVASGANLAELFLRLFDRDDNLIDSTRSQNQLATNNQLAHYCDNHHQALVTTSKSCLELFKRRSGSKKSSLDANGAHQRDN